MRARCRRVSPLFGARCRLCPPSPTPSPPSTHTYNTHARTHSYEDDRDEGEWFLYTGSGGRDLSGNKRTNKEQSFDQKFDAMNKALQNSCLKGLPVRVVRSYKARAEAPHACLLACWPAFLAASQPACLPPLHAHTQAHPTHRRRSARRTRPPTTRPCATTASTASSSAGAPRASRASSCAATSLCARTTSPRPGPLRVRARSSRGGGGCWVMGRLRAATTSPLASAVPGIPSPLFRSPPPPSTPLSPLIPPSYTYRHWRPPRAGDQPPKGGVGGG